MLDKVLLALPIFVVGMAVSLQGIVNSGLGKALGSSLIASAISFWVGTLTLTALSLVGGGVGQALSSGRSLAPGWWIAGGLCGAAYVSVVTFSVPRVGIAATIALIIAGQLVAAAVFDHYGVLGVPEHPMNLARAAGIAMLLGGALLVRLY